MRARTQLKFESTPGVGAKRFRAMLDESPEMDAARYGLALAQMKAGQLADAANSSAATDPRHRTTSPTISHRSNSTSPPIACSTLQTRLQRLLQLYHP